MPKVIKERVNGVLIEYVKVDSELAKKVDASNINYIDRPNDDELYIAKRDYERIKGK